MASLMVSAAVASALAASCKIIARLDAINKVSPIEQQAHLPGIATECLIMARVLAKIQSVILDDLILETALEALPDLDTTIDAALSGCCIVLSAVEADISSLVTIKHMADSVAWTAKNVTWEESKKKKLAYHLRYQNASINLLCTLLHMQSPAEQHHFLLENKEMFTTILHRAKIYHMNKAKRTLSREDGIFGSKSILWTKTQLLAAESVAHSPTPELHVGSQTVPNMIVNYPTSTTAPYPTPDSFSESDNTISRAESFLATIGKKATVAQETVDLGTELRSTVTKIESFKDDCYQTICGALEGSSSFYENTLNDLKSRIREYELNSALEPFTRISSMLLLRSNGMQNLDVGSKLAILPPATQHDHPVLQSQQYPPAIQHLPYQSPQLSSQESNPRTITPNSARASTPIVRTGTPNAPVTFRSSDYAPTSEKRPRDANSTDEPPVKRSKQPLKLIVSDRRPE